jgi:hypothetical protein
MVLYVEAVSLPFSPALFSVKLCPLRTGVLSLPDHLATVQQYLNEFSKHQSEAKSNDQSGSPVEGKDQKCTDSDSRQKQINNFATYLISISYQKVRRQLSNDLSTKLLFLLSSITGPQLERCLEESLKDPVGSKLGNVQLCILLDRAHGSEDPYDIQAMVRELKDKHYQPQGQSPSGEPGTPNASAFFEVVSKTNESIKSGTQDSSQLPILYNKETCVEFHYLLLLVLNKYWDAITQFRGQSMPGGPIDKDCRDLRFYSILLWRLSCSSILQDHLTFLRSNSLLQMQHGNGSKASDGDKEIGVGEEGMDGDEDEAVSSHDTGIMEEIAVLESDQSHRKDPALMIRRWLCLLVSHLQALHVLSSFALSYSSKMRLQHVAVKSSTFGTPQDWTAVLKRALTGPTDFFTIRRFHQSQFQQLEDLILEKIDAVHEGSGRKGLFRYFKGKTITGACGQVHAEAGLAAGLHGEWFDVRHLFYFLVLLHDLYMHGCALTCAIVARVSGLGSRHLCIKSIASSERFPITSSERDIRPSTASRMSWKGEIPPRR